MHINTTALVTPYYTYHLSDQGPLVAVTLFNERHEKLTVVFGGYECPEGINAGPFHRVRYVSGVVGAVQTLSQILAVEFKALDDLSKSFELVDCLFPVLSEKPQPAGQLLDFELTKLQLLAALEFPSDSRDIGPAIRYWWAREGEFKEFTLGELVTYAGKFGVELSSDGQELWLVGGFCKVSANGTVTKYKRALEALEDDEPEHTEGLENEK